MMIEFHFFATKSSLNIPPHLKHVATLPCKILMSETGETLMSLSTLK